LYYTDGSWKYSNNIRLSPVASSEYAVDVRPVPFDDKLTIRITAPGSQTAGITLYDMQGRPLYATNSQLSKGLNVITLDGNRFAAGVYTIVIRSAEHKLARKIIKL
jgi:hypothetical protein